MIEEHFSPEEFLLEDGEMDPLDPIGEDDEETEDDDAAVEGPEDDADAI
jgi:hypothetical protein